MSKQMIPEIRFEGFEDEWEEINIGENSNVFAGGTPSTQTPSYWEPKEVPWLSSGEVHKKVIYNTDNKISFEGLNNSSAHWVTPNSVLIALAGQGKTRGTVAVNKIALTTNQSIAAIEPNEKLYYNFLFNNLENRYEELRLMSAGDGGRGGLNNKIISKINIVSPTSTDEQKTIGNYFENLDKGIKFKKQEIVKLKSFKQAMLQKMFPKKGEKEPEVRFEGFSGEWESKKIKDIYNNISDGDWIQTEHISNEGSYRIIQTGNIGLGKYIDNRKNAKFLKIGSFDKLNANEIYPGDILISRLAEPAGRTIILPKLSEKMVTAVDVMIIRPQSNIDSRYFKYLMNTNTMLEKISFNVTGTTHQRISRKNLQETTCFFPSHKEQTKIGNFFKELDNKIEFEEQNLEKLKQFKKAMLQKMFV